MLLSETACMQQALCLMMICPHQNVMVWQHNELYRFSNQLYLKTHALQTVNC